MNTAVKKIVSIPLLALSVMPLLFSFYFIIHQKIIRHEMEERLEKSLLQTLQLKKEDFVWVKKGKEIRIDNHLFDVKSIKVKNGICEIKGLYDKDEDILHEQLNKSQNNPDQQSQKLVMSFFFQLIYPAPENNLNEYPSIINPTEYPVYLSLYLPSPETELLFPPPQA